MRKIQVHTDTPTEFKVGDTAADILRSTWKSEQRADDLGIWAIRPGQHRLALMSQVNFISQVRFLNHAAK